jgi:hypothetical protein
MLHPLQTSPGDGVLAIGHHVPQGLRRDQRPPLLMQQKPQGLARTSQFDLAPDEPETFLDLFQFLIDCVLFRFKAFKRAGHFLQVMAQLRVIGRHLPQQGRPALGLPDGFRGLDNARGRFLLALSAGDRLQAPHPHAGLLQTSLGLLPPGVRQLPHQRQGLQLLAQHPRFAAQDVHP